MAALPTVVAEREPFLDVYGQSPAVSPPQAAVSWELPSLDFVAPYGEFGQRRARVAWEAPALFPGAVFPEHRRVQVVDANEANLVTAAAFENEQQLSARPLTLPRERFDASAWMHLDREARRAIQILEAILVTSSFTAHVPVEEVAVHPFTDPEEGWKQITFMAKVRCSALQALAFWDYLGAQVDKWRATLSTEKADFLAQTFSVCVEW